MTDNRNIKACLTGMFRCGAWTHLDLHVYDRKTTIVHLENVIINVLQAGTA